MVSAPSGVCFDTSTEELSAAFGIRHAVGVKGQDKPFIIVLKGKALKGSRHMRGGNMRQ